MIAWEYILSFLTLSAAILSAATFGQAQEKISAAAMAISALLSALLSSGTFVGPEKNIFLIDIALFSVLFKIALDSTKLWPLLACGFHLNAVLVHAASFFPIPFEPGAYADSLVVWSHLACLALAIGAWWERPVCCR